MHRQQQQLQQQQQTVQQQQQTTQEQRVSSFEQHVTRQFTSQQKGIRTSTVFPSGNQVQCESNALDASVLDFISGVNLTGFIFPRRFCRYLRSFYLSLCACRSCVCCWSDITFKRGAWYRNEYQERTQRKEVCVLFRFWSCWDAAGARSRFVEAPDMGDEYQERTCIKEVCF
uniref:Uncharacterized protein n=1 Tax=Timema tahoe TaxID=61484 RepID=A0A7R9IIN8_9NEOP|nr:unnamed protein product [Timema tahoe]